jgi:hypothetical protein
LRFAFSVKEKIEKVAMVSIAVITARLIYPILWKIVVIIGGFLKRIAA